MTQDSTRDDSAREGSARNDGTRDGNARDASVSDDALDVREARAVADRMRRLAGSIARQQATFLTLLDRIDRTEAWAHWIGIRTLVQWVAFVCEMDPHTAREHVRVMRGLREMPQVAQLLSSGRISFSKAREITRLAGRIDDEEAAGITRQATASQISAMVSAYRRVDQADTNEMLDTLVGPRPSDASKGSPEDPGASPDESARASATAAAQLPAHLEQDSLHLSRQQSGRARLILDLPEAEALELLAALDAVCDATSSDEGPANRVDALLELVRAHRDGTGSGRSVSSARATLVVHVSPEALAAASGAHAHDGAEAHGVSDTHGGPDVHDGPDAPQSEPSRPERCHIADRGPITGATAARLACGGALVGALIDDSGDVLALGRSRRLASPQQKLALSARDLHCQFPSCARRANLEAHHIRMWSEGGPTDLDNMLLLCRSHHIAVHENRLRITRSGECFSGALRAGRGFAFYTEDGVRIRPGDPDALEAPVVGSGPDADGVLTRPLVLGLPGARLGPQEPEIVTEEGGWGFTLDAGITWLFDAEATLRERLRRGEVHPPEGDCA